VLARLSGHAKRVSAVAFHPTRDVLVTASHDATVKVWTNAGGDGGDSGAPPAAFDYSSALTLRGHTKEVTGVAVHPTGDYLLSAGRDGAWAFHDLAAGRVLAVVGAGADTAPYESVRWHPDGVILAAGTDAGPIRVYDIRTQEVAATFQGHAGVVAGLALSENGYFMASAGADATLRLWDLRKLANFHTITAPGPLTAAAFDFSGNFLAAGAADGAVAVWRSSDWEPVTRWAGGAGGAGHTAAVTGVAFAPLAASLVTSSLDRSLKVFARAPQ
jgi:pre-mRNA-processing factor 19